MRRCADHGRRVPVLYSTGLGFTRPRALAPSSRVPRRKRGRSCRSHRVPTALVMSAPKTRRALFAARASSRGRSNVHGARLRACRVPCSCSARASPSRRAARRAGSLTRSSRSTERLLRSRTQRHRQLPTCRLQRLPRRRPRLRLHRSSPRPRPRQSLPRRRSLPKGRWRRRTELLRRRTGPRSRSPNRRRPEYECPG